jgi:hypothetical protein
MLDIVSTLEEISELLEQKNKDYGNAWQELATVTVAVRIMDKARRYANLVKQEERNFENLDDTLRDITGYALLGLLWLDDRVPVIGIGHFGLGIKEVSKETLRMQFGSVCAIGRGMYQDAGDNSDILMQYARDMLQVVDSAESTVLVVHKPSAEYYLARLAYLSISLILNTPPNDNPCVNDGTFEVF